MPKKKKTPSGSTAAKPWLPDEKSIIEVKEIKSPSGAPMRIIRTNIVDPYEPKLPKPKKKR